MGRASLAGVRCHDFEKQCGIVGSWLRIEPRRHQQCPNAGCATEQRLHDERLHPCATEQPLYDVRLQPLCNIPRLHICRASWPSSPSQQLQILIPLTFNSVPLIRPTMTYLLQVNIVSAAPASPHGLSARAAWAYNSGASRFSYS